MPDTSLEGLTYPDSSGSTQLWTHFQALAEDADAAIAKRRGRGIPTATTTATSTDGTGSSGTTDTRDAVLGSYVFTAVANRRYRAVFSGGLINGSVANDRFAITIRNGGASTPTSASTAVAGSSRITAITGSNGRHGADLTGTFTPTAGTVTLSVFVQRQAGTGIGTLVGARELYVEDIGPSV